MDAHSPVAVYFFFLIIGLVFCLGILQCLVGKVQRHQQSGFHPEILFWEGGEVALILVPYW